MWWAGEVVDVYVGTQQMVFWRGEQGLAVQPVEAAGPDLGAGLKTAGLVARRWPRTRLRVWLSGALAQPFVMAPVQGLRNWGEALAAGSAKAAAETGWVEPAAVWLDALPSEQAALGVAVAQPMLDALNRSAAQAGVRLQSIRPWWALALNDAREGGDDFDLLAVEDTDALVLISATAGRWQEATTYAPKPAADQSDAVVQRRATAQGFGADRIRRCRPAAQALDGSTAVPMQPSSVQGLAFELA